MRRLLTWLSLFTSFSTLVCCAIPALLVALGMGAALVGLIGAVPGLVWPSENKAIVFGSGAALLAAGGWLQWRARNEVCPVDPQLGAACATTRDWSRPVYFFSLAVFAVGAFFAFVAPRIFS